MNKFKEVVNSVKDKKVLLTSALTGALICSPLSVFAAETSVSTVITSSFQKVVTDTLESIAAIAPIGITVFAATFVWKYAKKFFSTIAK